MYTLYWERLSGSIAPEVLLEEIGAPYQRYRIDMAGDAHRKDAYRTKNPLCRIPALALPDGEVIGETSAITLVLGERHPAAGLVPMPGDPDRPAFLFWLAGMAANGYPIFSRAWHPEQFTLDETANETVRLRAEEHLEDFFTTMDQAIRGAPYFLPRGFTALDVYLTMLTEWSADRQGLFGRHSRLAALCTAVQERASYREVIARHNETSSEAIN
ncbi:glutathione S-transferase family protein [Roseibium aggregatum]|uniref:Glutathione S-transferase n=1 Tax=Roseibium aggregatum TaxID=187304 RepID=A0A926NZ07_9HYPH|nr:glutathione S-transferase [Roseibium aggregatum]MBD1546230.1 glutathione S-transferase [Roseibium aggregatum]